MCTERIINSTPKKIGHVYRERIRPAYSTPHIWGRYYAQKKDRKSTGVQRHTVAHTHRGRESRGQDALAHHSHSTTQTHHRQGRQGTGRTTGQGHSTTQKHSTQKKEQESTQEYIEVCYSSSVEHKGTDHTVTPNHSTCSPQRGHGTRHQSLRCVLFCVQAGHGIAVGTTQTQNAMRGEEGAAFLPIK